MRRARPARIRPLPLRRLRDRAGSRAEEVRDVEADRGSTSPHSFEVAGVRVLRRYAALSLVHRSRPYRWCDRPKPRRYRIRPPLPLGFPRADGAAGTTWEDAPTEGEYGTHPTLGCRGRALELPAIAGQAPGPGLSRSSRRAQTPLPAG